MTFLGAVFYAGLHKEIVLPGVGGAGERPIGEGHGGGRLTIGAELQL